MNTKTTPIELAREIDRTVSDAKLLYDPALLINLFKQYPALAQVVACGAVALAQAVIDSPVGLTKGERMPQTPEDFAYMADRYEEALLREKDEISRLNAKLNKLEQKVAKSYQRGHAEGVRKQKEKDAVIAEEYAEEKGSYDQMGYCLVIAKAIRET